MDLYEKLANRLQQMPGGFPRTAGGIEIKLLKKIFKPEEAELFMHLTLIPEKPRVIAFRSGLDIDTVRERLEVMSKKGLTYAVYPKKGQPKYQAFHFFVGIWEFQVNSLTPEIAADMEEYWKSIFDLDLWGKNPQMRVIPINKDVEVVHEIMSYEQAEKIVGDHEIFSVSPCICRQEQEVKGNKCDRPLETCLQFGQIAEFYIHRGVARKITREEAFEKLRLANDNGLVLQPSNSKTPAFICCCCSCCCAVFKNIKRNSRPADIVNSPFTAIIDSDICTGCEICINRCQMEAIVINAGKPEILTERCIGCGLCVTTCNSKAVKLYRKPKNEQKPVPKIWDDALIRLGKNRKKLNTLKMAGMFARSVYDRLRS